MKKNCLKQWSLATISFITMLVMTFPSGAAPARGKITKVDSSSISGWAWNPEDTNDVQQVELHIFQSGGSEPVKYLHVAAEEYREDLAAECLLPVMVDHLIRTGALEVDVLRSADRWFGMT